jgi:hypothetical protein
MTKAEIEVAVQKCADRINADFVGEKIILTGILKGAFIFMTDLARKLTRPYSIYFLEASSYVSHFLGYYPISIVSLQPAADLRSHNTYFPEACSSVVRLGWYPCFDHFLTTCRRLALAQYLLPWGILVRLFA